MRRISRLEPVKPFLGILYKDKSVLENVLNQIQKELNPIDQLSESYPFDQTDYYKKEMGSGLMRTFALLQQLIDPSEIKSYKHYCFELELQHSCNGYRSINLDPGYLNFYQLVLTSVKALPHKLYLGEGVFGEIEMIYKDKQFRPMEWAYADYRTFTTLFHEFRERYAEQMIQKGRPTIHSPFDAKILEA